MQNYSFDIMRNLDSNHDHNYLSLYENISNMGGNYNNSPKGAKSFTLVLF
jgi:hypothetical protein